MSALAAGGWLAASGCAWHSPIGAGQYIKRPVAPPDPPPADPLAARLPDPPPDPPAPPRPPDAKGPAPYVPRPDPAAPLLLPEVLASVEASFPLLYAIQQEAPIAGGQRLSAEGAYDLVARSRYVGQQGSYDNRQFDLGLEQLALNGTRVSAGYRFGQGAFPSYQGGLVTAEDGEFRVGLTVPLLRDRAIDPARARLRAAEIQEQLADPTIRRGRIDFFRDAALAYWAWAAAGGLYQVEEELLKLASDRQTLLDAQRKEGAENVVSVTLNRRLLAERQVALNAAKQQLERAGVALSRFVRDDKGDPLVPPTARLPFRFIDLVPPPPNRDAVPADAAAAQARRPELVRFRLLREQFAVDYKLAANQRLPAVNFVAGMAEDAGPYGSTGLDRSTLQLGVAGDLPVQRRDPEGRARTAQARMVQAAEQERDARDRIGIEVADAAAVLTNTYERVTLARGALQQAVLVREQTTLAFRNDRDNLVTLNIQESAAAGAQARVVLELLAYFQATALYQAALGQDTPQPVPGAVLPAVPTGQAAPNPQAPLPKPADPPPAKKP
jgi:outer membrane protein TolC